MAAQPNPDESRGAGAVTAQEKSQTELPGPFVLHFPSEMTPDLSQDLEGSVGRGHQSLRV
jgi:hypothetical protein